MIEIDDPNLAYREFPGPVLLLAGPGTGKTYQLAQRIKFLVSEQKISPSEIAVITFTTEAARNMRERLLRPDINLPRDSHPEIINTMHSLGNMIIGANTSLSGLTENYSVLTEKESQIILFQDASFLCGFKREHYEESYNCRRLGECVYDVANPKCKICEKYEYLLRKCSLIDYDDQIFLANKVLRENEEIYNLWSQRTKYLLVDEYQDINPAQFELISLLSSQNREGLFVVGDDDQSIYSFRGGTPDYLLSFEGDFGSGSKVGKLSKSWRCPEIILKSAKSVINKYYPSSIPKPEPTFSDDVSSIDAKIFILDVPSSKKEAEYIARISKKNYQDKKVCVIIPNANYYPEIRDSLRRLKIPFKYKPKFSDDGLDRFLLFDEWLNDDKNNILSRIILNLLINNHNDFTSTFPIDSSSIKQKREAFSNFIASLWEEVNSDTSLIEVLYRRISISEFAEIVNNLKDYLDEIVGIIKSNGGKKIFLPIFLEKAGLYFAPGKHPNGFISEIKEWKTEIMSGNMDSSFPPIEIYNMPSSKGLEGDVIIIVGLTHSLFPNPEKDVGEQSRLFYVALTRAKEEIYLFNARSRSSQITFLKESFMLKKSEFLKCLPADYIKSIYIKQ